MSLTQALNTALSGLNAAQTSVSVVAGNIANAQTPGYVR
jgi:flagellar hook-associated protein 1 FlgK